MNKNETKTTEKNTLRHRAEQEIASGSTRKTQNIQSHDLSNLVHELETHQIELEMQNEELRRIQVELIESRDQYSELYDYSPIGYLTTEKTGRIVQANLTLMQMLGIPRSKIINNFLAALIIKEDQDIYYLYQRKVLEVQNSTICEVRFYNLNDCFIWVRLNSICVRNKDGECEKIRLTISDITEYKKLETQLHQTQKMESLGTLAGGIAHDFNNMLAVILGNANHYMSKLQGKSSEDISCLENIITAANRSTELVKQVLSFGRMDIIELKPHNLSLIVAESVQMLSTAIPTNIEIKQDIQNGGQRVLADNTKLQQVIINIIYNAVSAMEEKGGVLTVTLKEHACDACDACEASALTIKPFKHCMVITISDTGIGISQEQKQNVFDPFFTTKDTGKGTGLGLAVGYTIVQRHDGNIRFDSEVNQGSTVTICLPVLAETVSPP